MKHGYVPNYVAPFNSFVNFPITPEIDLVWNWDIRKYIVDCPVPVNETIMEVGNA